MPVTTRSTNADKEPTQPELPKMRRTHAQVVADRLTVVQKKDEENSKKTEKIIATAQRELARREQESIDHAQAARPESLLKKHREDIDTQKGLKSGRGKAAGRGKASGRGRGGATNKSNRGGRGGGGRGGRVNGNPTSEVESGIPAAVDSAADDATSMAIDVVEPTNEHEPLVSLVITKQQIPTYAIIRSFILTITLIRWLLMKISQAPVEMNRRPLNLGRRQQWMLTT